MKANRVNIVKYADKGDDQGAESFKGEWQAAFEAKDSGFDKSANFALWNEEENVKFE